MKIDWNAILNGSLVFLIVFVIKILLDFNLAKFIVKYFFWLPLRNYFRTKPLKINGKWEENWSLNTSDNFKEKVQRHSHPTVKQFDKYCYAEFIANGKTYGVFGKVVNDSFVGEWFDLNDPIGYFGAFHLLIIDATKMKGKWIGHSKTLHGIREGDWEWQKRK
ncbi:hypothetical protein [Mucilaginibacter pedocola]|uniref:Uncharacterized protein n=1 Tax=Mucilaginibacter pedocola TaxID=1792845 RepID=A0A1S9PAY4_9SPHI|nr:hypothetical protein [Mucilaginibacter pedocola]OOQ57977.1 hypothetical protein BC343_09910 [Mucilaginibacter pedocola]